MAKRKIIEIDEDKCNGCGKCIIGCPEGALKIIDGKARLVSDFYCDGLGACIGTCPQNAIKVIEREADDYDERKVMARIVKQGSNVIKEHLTHLKDHNETEYFNQAVEYLKEKKIKNPLEGEEMKSDKIPCGCPGTAMKSIKPKAKKSSSKQESSLSQWPVQLNLLPPTAPFFDNAHLLVAADCVPFANANFHSELLHGKALVIGCPKLDDIEEYKEKFVEIFKNNKIKSVTVAIMEVPCCYGMFAAVEEAVEESGKKIPLIQQIVGVNGELQ